MLPEGASCIFSGVMPIVNVGWADIWGTGVSAPVPESMENTEMSNEPEFPTYRYFPAESITIKVGAVPASTRGVTSVIAPVLEIVNNEMLLAPEFAAYRNFLEGCSTSDSTPSPAVTGLPANCVNTPAFGSSRKITI